MSERAAESAQQSPKPPADDNVDAEVSNAFRTLQSAMLRASSGTAQLQQIASGQAYIYAGLQRIETLLERLIRVGESQLETTLAQESYSARMANMQLSWIRKEGPYKIVPNVQGQDPTAPPSNLPGLWYPSDLLKLSKADAVKYLQLYGYAVEADDVALADAKFTIAAEIGMAAIDPATQQEFSLRRASPRKRYPLKREAAATKRRENHASQSHGAYPSAQNGLCEFCAQCGALHRLKNIA